MKEFQEQIRKLDEECHKRPSHISKIQFFTEIIRVYENQTVTTPTVRSSKYASQTSIQ
jgi:hypothetical protein